jgi:DNA-binding response OmpR family regulator
MKKILIIEDDENILRLESDYLEANHFEVEAYTNGEQGLQVALSKSFDLILLDVMLPKVDGLTICKKVREVSNIPIIIVSAKRDDLDKIKGLGFGADDYIVKPFSPSELVARVIAHISRYERLTSQGDDNSQSIIEIGSLKIDKNSRRVYMDGTEIVFTNKEFDLLACLAEKPDNVFDKEYLFEKIWKYDSMGDTSTVTVHINRIREKLFSANKNSDYIHTIWGKGYRFNK